MDAIVTLLQTLNSLSPLAVIALLGLVIYMLVSGKTAAAKRMDAVKQNDLHELPEIAETLRRIEIRLSEEFSYIRARLNGGPRA